jgi:hypothetical protein
MKYELINLFAETIAETEPAIVTSTSYAILGLVFICAATFAALSIAESLLKATQL